jgi:hypothetical protein
MRDEGAKPKGAPAKPAVPAAQQPSPAAAVAAPVPKAPEPAKQGSKKASSGQSIALEEKFYASQRDIFECFTDARRVQAFTQSPAEIQAQPGGTFRWAG